MKSLASLQTDEIKCLQEASFVKSFVPGVPSINLLYTGNSRLTTSASIIEQIAAPVSLETDAVKQGASRLELRSQFKHAS